MGDESIRPDAPNPTMSALLEALELLGRSLTVYGATGKLSRARKHGYQPAARTHVENMLMRQVLGIEPAAIAHAGHWQKRTVERSITQGLRIARANALILGLTPEEILRYGRSWSTARRDDELDE